MIETFFLILYLTTYASGSVMLIIFFFAMRKTPSAWLKSLFVFLACSLFFILTRNLSFFAKAFLGLHDLEKTVVFYVLYMVSCSLLVSTFFVFCFRLKFGTKDRSGKVIGLIAGIIPILLLFLPFLAQDSGDPVGLRLILMAIMMFFAYGVAVWGLCFTIFFKGSIRNSFQNSVLNVFLKSCIVNFIIATSMGLFYSGNGFSLYRFSVINISLTYLYISCSVIVARNCLLPEQARSRAIDLLSLPSMPENDKKIIAMIQRGASNKEIAQELKLTLPTIKHINYRIFSRFNVKCRTELISTLQELGSRENPEAREEQIFGQTENAF